MDIVERILRRGAWDTVDVNRLLKLSDIDARIQGHLCRVYVSLAGALACTALSVACMMMFHLVNSIFAVGLGVLGTGVGLTGLAMWRGDAAGGPKDRARHALLLTVAGGQGLIICPVAKHAFDINPQAVLPVILATVTVFVSFSAAALFAKRRAYLFLGGYFLSAVTALMVLHLGSWPTAGVAAATGNEVSLYLSLLAFAGFIVFDTQLIIERVSVGEKDHIQHALELFLGVVGLAVQALAVLTRKAARGGARRRAKRSGPHS